MEYIARYYVREEGNRKKVIRQGLKDHLRGVSLLAESFGTKVHCSKFMRLAGVLHDMGKYCPSFQNYITNAMKAETSSNGEAPATTKEKVDHGVYGAKFIFEKHSKTGGYAAITAELLLLICCFHHGNLPSAINKAGKATATERIGKIEKEELDQVFETFQNEVNIDVDALFAKAVKEIEAINTQIREQKLVDKNKDQFIYNLLIKLFYSMLVDADRVDSMCFEDGETEWKRYLYNKGSRIAQFKEYQKNVEETYRAFRNKEPDNQNIKKVNDIRNSIADACLEAGKRSGGVYRLTVPTGGGKTLASMRYALEHTVEYEKERILYFLPFTTITSQNADVFRDVLGEGCDLLEHHSNTLEENRAEDYRLLTTRWENDIVISTTVQFLNTFYESGTQDVRRLHNMANSVIIFDEVQTIPINCMNLFRSAVLFLSEVMGATVVLCTATQPAVAEARLQPLFKSQIRELTEDTNGIFAALKRVKVVDETKMKPYAVDEAVDYIIDKKQNVNSLLVVLNKVKSVQQVYEKLNDRIDEDTKLFHLSSSMAPVHKGDILKCIKDCLEKGESIICISTATIEAGVDISFEAAIRNLTKLDSIAQAAGRVNRNGERQLGYCYVINLNEGSYSNLTEIEIGGKKSRTTLEAYDDVLFPAAIQHYFHDFYSDQEIFSQFDYPYQKKDLYSLLTTSRNPSQYGYIDEGVQGYPLCFCIQFAEAAKAFEAIKGLTHSLIVPYGDGQRLVDALIELSFYAPTSEKKNLLEKAKGYTINVYDYMLRKLREEGAVSFHDNLGIYILSDGYYNTQTGLVLETKSEDFMI